MSDQTRGGLLSPFLREMRLRAVKPFLTGRILDVGCAGGDLARYCKPADYVGYDLSQSALKAARVRFPCHRFVDSLDGLGDFDAIAALALIEHIPDPASLLQKLRTLLKNSGSVILTTPAPSMERVHYVGSRLGLFSAEANEEHEELIGVERMNQITEAAGFEVKTFKRFLFGANQLFIISPKG